MTEQSLKEPPAVITISGLPGSGKSTLGKNLANKLGYRYFSVGSILREMARKGQKTLLQISREAEQNAQIDQMLDQKMLEFAKTNRQIVIDSRLAARFLKENNIEGYHIFLDASPAVRAKRIGQREHIPIKDALPQTRERENSEARRYKTLYNIDINDKSVYDSVIKTDQLTRDQVLNKILKQIYE
ncbi:MAG: cytidylate kinase family protein [Parcubacteria group bacterium]|nr:cytidylate kinase family protein [Parcubacteria group bacterium]